MTNLIIELGAIPDSVKLIPEITPISYLPGLATRMKIKAIGDLDVSTLKPDFDNQDDSLKDYSIDIDNTPFEERPRSKIDESDHDYLTWIPDHHFFREHDGRTEWLLEEADIECIALGAGILGAGGGASPYLSTLVAKEFKKLGY